ncbi:MULTISPECIES: ribokinase [Rhizobium]|uniref:Ribokinase n=1 Tax=Rhizobium rhizogenes (strain K84 / ATCC BAA-868) TaxID=311403 RepID=B9J8C2_RHIR8|nr:MULTISPECIES: ribokinase [Rhizobium]ACM25309.1 ribokinase [Rhizobium rhizogenes K84]OCI97936.1 ribokinase [Agrobacterium sp. 13-626]OCJ21661.1 ribokinase [Agrobacterium sp. B131/95]EJK82819.1 sugar kinase, ribokinase [Rhizobium sp. AP16]KEA05094.1 ribokinase [Rhizobium rhizogenes]
MITIFGSINMDLIATTDRLPKPGETVAGNGFSTAAGGKGANQALAARRAGSTVRLTGAVGNDGFAEPALALLDAAGTDLSTVAHVSEPTGTALILVGGDGENMIAVVPGANGTKTAEDATAVVDALSASDTLMLQFEIPVAAVETALTAAKAKGVRTVLNLAPLIPEAARLGRLADIVIANETEFELLAGQDNMSASDREAALIRLHAETGQTLIVTLGGDGVIAIRNGELSRAKGLVIEPVDTVGAGDTFCGYFAASLDQGLDFHASLRRAAVAGSLACLKPGAQPAIPVASDVVARL